MATNYLGVGATYTFTNDATGATTIDAGDGVLVGSLFGVAVTDIAADASGAIALTGVWSLAKVSAQAWTAGQVIYWDDAAGNATNDDNTAGLVVIGKAYAAADNPSSTGSVRLDG